MVIQNKEYNHTLGSLTPLGLVPQSVSTSRSHISSGFPFGMCIEKERWRWLHHIRYAGGSVRQRNHLSKVASRLPALSGSVSWIRPGSRAVTNSDSRLLE